MAPRWIAASLLLGAAAWGAAAEPKCLYEDARITGKTIHTFTDEGEPVAVVLGEFRLRVGRCEVTGRDGVVWVRGEQVGRATRHHLTIYAEGDAHFVRYDGTVAADSSLLVRLVQQGRLSIAGQVAPATPRNLPQYQRALAARRQPPEPAIAAPTTRPVPRAPRLIRVTTTQPAPPPPVEPKAVMPVHLHADHLSSRLVDGERVTVARGHVYLSQGNPESTLFIELRSQAAVVFSEEVSKPAAARSPLSPRIGEVGGETITGVYLEGDVVIARGERFLRSERAFYDFIADRAYAPDAVFRTIQEQRNIPIYIRAKEARALSARELYFRGATISTSEFWTPTYDVSASRTYLMDTAPYDEASERIGPQSWLARMRHTVFHIRGIAVAWLPSWEGDFTEGHTPLRRVRVGHHGKFGLGVDPEWHLFRLPGLSRPAGASARLDLDWYEAGVLAGVKWD
jgi:hypothetical protein